MEDGNHESWERWLPAGEQMSSSLLPSAGEMPALPDMMRWSSGFSLFRTAS
jgi:hypothetical protein